MSSFAELATKLGLLVSVASEQFTCISLTSCYFFKQSMLN